MADKRSEERSSDASGAKKNKTGGSSKGKDEDMWFHEASDTESDALRAMIGKRVEVDEEDGDEMDDGDENDNFSEK